MYTAITLGAAAILSLILLLLTAKHDTIFYRTLRITTAVFCVIGFFRFMLCDGFIHVINGGVMHGTYYETSDILSTIIRWGYFANYSIIPMAVFTKSRLFRNLACYYCLPFSILSAVYFERFMTYFTQDTGVGIYAPPTFRYVYFVLELTLAILLPVALCIRDKHFMRVTDPWEILRFIGLIPLVAFCTMPAYAPQSIWGNSNIKVKTFGVTHILWMVALVLIILALYYAFRFRSYEDRYNLCLFLTFALFFHYNSLYLMGFSLPRLPIQLCNLAAFFYMVAIPLKLNKFFQFCFIVNITGTLIAILSPDFATTGVGFWNLHYVYEHSLVLIIPALAMGLRIFPRVTRRSLKYSAIGFVCYFAFCIIGGGLLNVFSDYTGQEVNYFFMFDLDKATSFVKIVSFADILPIRIGAYTFYPILMAIVFVAFSLLSVGFYRLVLYLYKVEDDQFQLRCAGLDILEHRLGRPTKLPREFRD